MATDAALNTSEGRMNFSGVKKMSSLGVKENDNKSSTRPPPPTKRKGCSDEKSKDDSKEKGASKELSGKDGGGDRTLKRHSAAGGEAAAAFLSSSSVLSHPGHSSTPPRPQQLCGTPSGTFPVQTGQQEAFPSRMETTQGRRTGQGSRSPKSTKEHTGRLTRNVPKDHVGTSLSSFGKINVIDKPPERMHRHLSKRLRLCAV